MITTQLQCKFLSLSTTCTCVYVLPTVSCLEICMSRHEKEFVTSKPVEVLHNFANVIQWGRMLYSGLECQILVKCRGQELWHSFQLRNSRNYSLIPTQFFRGEGNTQKSGQLDSAWANSLKRFLFIFRKEQICVFLNFGNQENGLEKKIIRTFVS